MCIFEKTCFFFLSTEWFISTKTKKQTNLQNPEVLDAGEVDFSDPGDVVSVQIPAERNTEVTG